MLMETERNITCAELLKQINDGLTKHLNNELKKYEITFSQLNLLTLLFEQESRALSPTELKNILRVAQPTIAGIVKRLNEKEYINIITNPDDSRKKMVKLTEAGEECCKAAETYKVQTEEKLLSGLSKAEQEYLFSFLKVLRNSLI